MLVYRPDRFKAAYETLNGKELWQELNTPESILIMETACYVRRPAIEPLSPKLQRIFPNICKSVTMRRMVGHMVRQILEDRGYGLYRSNIRIVHSRNIFSFGSTYHHTGEAFAV